MEETEQLIQNTNQVLQDIKNSKRTYFDSKLDGFSTKAQLHTAIQCFGSGLADHFFKPLIHKNLEEDSIEHGHPTKQNLLSTPHSILDSFEHFKHKEPVQQSHIQSLPNTHEIALGGLESLCHGNIDEHSLRSNKNRNRTTLHRLSSELSFLEIYGIVMHELQELSHSKSQLDIEKMKHKYDSDNYNTFVESMTCEQQEKIKSQEQLNMAIHDLEIAIDFVKAKLDVLEMETLIMDTFQKVQDISFTKSKTKSSRRVKGIGNIAEIIIYVRFTYNIVSNIIL